MRALARDACGYAKTRARHGFFVASARSTVAVGRTGFAKQRRDFCAGPANTGLGFEAVGGGLALRCHVHRDLYIVAGVLF